MMIFLKTDKVIKGEANFHLSSSTNKSISNFHETIPLISGFFKIKKARIFFRVATPGSQDMPGGFATVQCVDRYSILRALYAVYLDLQIYVYRRSTVILFGFGSRAM
jgi:hypothetical protein